MPKKAPAPSRKRNIAGRGSDQFPLRLPEGMRELIKVTADQNGRSMNQEIIDVLREYFPDPPTHDELLDEAKFVLLQLRDLDNPSNRHEISAVLDSLRRDLSERLQGTTRSEPVVKIKRDTLDDIEQLANKMEIDRDQLAEALLDMGFKQAIETGLVRVIGIDIPIEIDTKTNPS